MFKTDKERLEIYMDSVAGYCRELLSFRGLEKDEESGNIINVDNQAKFEQLAVMQTRLRAMENVLGLTQAEKRIIYKKFGIKLGDF